MYKSPIELSVCDIQAEINKKIDEQVYRCVKGVGVNVDKEELIKALMYDRKQYRKGYVDGIKEFAEAYKDQIEDCTGMFTDEGFYIPRDAVLNSIDFIYERMAGES